MSKKPEARVNIAGHSIPVAVIIEALSQYEKHAGTVRFPITIKNIQRDLKTKIGHVATTEYVPKKIGKVQTLESFREALYKIKAMPENSMGICSNLYTRMNTGKEYAQDGVQDFAKTLFASWPEYSGDARYPIRTNKRMSGERQFDKTYHYWDQNTVYGKARMRLLDHMILETTIQIDAERKRQGF